MDSKSQYVKINDLCLHYLNWGVEGKKPLICLHGLTANANLWNHFSREVRTQYHVFALDQRGHGESQWASDDYDLERYVSDLLAYIDYLERDSVTLVGSSLGGLVSMRCAALYPDRIERIVVVDMSPTPGAHVTKRMLKETDSPLEFESLDAAVKWASSSYLWARDDVLRVDLAKRLRQRKDGHWVWKADPNTWSRKSLDLVNKHTKEYWHSFSNIQCPILIVRGIDSDVLTEAIKQKMQTLNDNCEWSDIQGAGHNVAVDQPEEFLKAVCPFLGITMDKSN